MMTKLADELEALVTLVASILEGWDMKEPPNEYTGHDYRDVARSIIAALRQPDAVPGDLVERTYSKNRPPSVGDPVICMARPDWNIGTVQHISDETRIITCGFWADHGYFQVGKSVLEIDHAATYLRRTAAAIQSLTAERDALQQALADTQGAMTLTAEIGVTYFDQRNEATAERDAALARVAELERPSAWPTEQLDAMVRAWDENKNKHGLRETLMAVVCAANSFRALLEGSKP